MTWPAGSGDGTKPDNTMQVQAQVLIELGKQTAQLAVITTKLDALVSTKDDHEARLRALEVLSNTVQGGRDNQARVVSWAATAAAIGSGIAAYLHH